jgi:hypothetical protein
MHILELIFTDIQPGKEPNVNPVLTVTSGDEIEVKEHLYFNSASQRNIELAPGTYTLTVKSVETFTTEFEVPDAQDTIISVEVPAKIVYAIDS